jgi:HEAT repeat protein
MLLIALGSLRAEPVDPYPLFDWPASHLPWDYPDNEIIVFEPRLLDLWLEALGQPTVTTRCEAVDAIAAAYREGMTQASRAGDALLKALREAKHPELRETIARALVTLDHHPAGNELLAINRQARPSMVVRLDPALARWDTAGAGDLWLSRLASNDTARQVRRSAIESLGAIGERRAIEPLAALCQTGDAPVTSRLVAADALAQLNGGRAADVAGALLAKPASLADRMIASRLLAHHDSAIARTLLMRLVDDDQPVVVAAAANRLARIDPRLLSDRVDRLMASPDARVRQVALVVLDAQATPAAIESLAWMLNDQNPHLRAEARLRLHGADANTDLTQTVRAAAMAKLASNSTDAIVEAAVLLGRLDHQPAAPRLVALLDDPRHDVRMASIVALRWLANPQTYTSLYDHAVRLSKWLILPHDGAGEAGYDAELRQVLQTFGAVKFHPADRLLRWFIPRDGEVFSGQVRSSAIWALGQIHADQVDESLCVALAARLMDVRARWSERHEVRLMSAMALGMMRARDHEHILRQFAAHGDAEPGVMSACQWALARITGESALPVSPTVRTRSGWFLEPIDPSR